MEKNTIEVTVAKVAVSGATLNYDKLYSYLVPAPLEGRIFVGSVVLIPFGRGAAKPRVGVVVECGACPLPERKLKEILDAAPAGAALDEEGLAMADYLRRTAFCTWYEAIRAVVPTPAQYVAVQEEGGWALRRRIRTRTEKVYRLTQTPCEGKNQKQRDVLALLAEGEQGRDDILERCGVGPGVLATLEKNGAVEVLLRQREVEETAQTDYVPARLVSGRAGAPMALTKEQRAVADALKERMERQNPKPALLFGVTGSGKTAVFLELVRHALQKGLGTLVLVPEIGLTPQMIAQLQAGFGDKVAVLHSGLSASGRLAQWQAVKSGAAPIVVGTRSAVFAPLPKLGLIIIDEEQERSYQSESAPRYDAVEMARRRAARHGALLVLASATPSVHSFYAAGQGRYELFRLKNRYGNLPLPAVDIVDTKEERMAGNLDILSAPLAEALRRTLEEGRQAILLLNRRGYHRLARCKVCGKVVKCGQCSVPMVFHRTGRSGHRVEQREFNPEALRRSDEPRAGGIRWSGAGAQESAPQGGNSDFQAAPHGPRDGEQGAGAGLAFSAGLHYHPDDAMMDMIADELPEEGYLLCHTCGERRDEAPRICPECGGPMRYDGFGTQRIQQELEEKFPTAKLLRMDLDSTARKGRHAAMLSAFSKGEYDLLVGTQMVAKGLDFDGVSLVGVVGIDALLGAPGYRALERVFSLVTQVVGRSGRADTPGRAIIQTDEPDHPVLRLAAKQDYEAFYDGEIAFRRMSLYPPFCGLCVVGFAAPVEQDAAAAASAFAAILQQEAEKRPDIPLRVLGPAPMNILQVAGSYRYRLTLKCREDAAFRALMGEVLVAFGRTPQGKKAQVSLDFHSDG